MLKRLIASYQPDVRSKRKPRSSEEEIKVNELDLNIIDATDPIVDAEPLKLNFVEIFAKLDPDLPPLPDAYEVK